MVHPSRESSPVTWTELPLNRPPWPTSQELEQADIRPTTPTANEEQPTRDE